MLERLPAVRTPGLFGVVVRRADGIPKLLIIAILLGAEERQEGQLDWVIKVGAADADAVGSCRGFGDVAGDFHWRDRLAKSVVTQQTWRFAPRISREEMRASTASQRSGDRLLVMRVHFPSLS